MRLTVGCGARAPHPQMGLQGCLCHTGPGPQPPPQLRGPRGPRRQGGAGLRKLLTPHRQPPTFSAQDKAGGGSLGEKLALPPPSPRDAPLNATTSRDCQQSTLLTWLAQGHLSAQRQLH